MKFEILQNGNLLEELDLAEGTHKIGRGNECPINLNARQVSSNHALLIIKGNKAAIVDTGSSNGVFVNGVLVKKQRIEMNDVVNIADYQIRILNPFRAASRAKQAVSSEEGNLAVNSEMETPENNPEEKPQQKIMNWTEQNLMTPFYALIRTYDWRVLLVSLLSISLILTVVMTVIPFARWGHQTATKEALARAHSILKQEVRENYRVLSKTTDVTRLSVSVAEKADGFLSVYIVDSKNGTVLAPTNLFNKSVSEPFSLLALKKVLEGKEEEVTVERTDDVYVLAQPIPYYGNESTTSAEDKSIPQPNAVILANFRIGSSIASTYEPLVEACIFSVFLSLLCYFLITKLASHPVLALQEQIDAALKGENVTIQSEAKWTELENLATTMNFAVARMKQAGGGLAQAMGGSPDDGVEDEDYLRSVNEFESGTSDAVLVLDKDKKVKFVGHILEELVGLRNEYALGQNISDACRDQSFAGTAIDLTERVIQSLGDTQTAKLDVNGISREIVCVAHKTRLGDIRFVLITIKMGAM